MLTFTVFTMLPMRVSCSVYKLEPLILYGSRMVGIELFYFCSRGKMQIWMCKTFAKKAVNSNIYCGEALRL